jgi:exonuclease SbcC
LALQAAPSATREQLQVASDNARSHLERVTAQASMLSSQAQQASIDQQQKEQRLLENLAHSSFPDLSSLRAALLTDDEWRARNDWLVDWEKREQQRLTLLGAAEQRLTELAALHAPDPETCSTLRSESAALEQTMLELAKEHTLLEEKLRRDAQQREAYERRSAESEQQLKELEIWQIMRGLIGSHDGAKFRKFAQGVSLDILTHHANKHLQQLSERYRLQRQEHVDLTLEIIDQFQANCTRPMSSLSGGESFLVSLALALGLSDLAGRNVRIDSLFIDEGFGSLDADALDAAISTLESLHQQNKTIGVISHIDLVKERIHTKINVRRLSAGSSTLDVA